MPSCHAAQRGALAFDYLLRVGARAQSMPALGQLSYIEEPTSAEICLATERQSALFPIEFTVTVESRMSAAQCRMSVDNPVLPMFWGQLSQGVSLRGRDHADIGLEVFYRDTLAR